MMRRPTAKYVLYVILVTLMLTACTGKSSATQAPPTAPPVGTDVATLIALSEQATRRARQEAADAVLLQIYTDLIQTSFRFRDAAKTKEIFVLVPTASTPPDQWTARIDPISKPAPGIDVQGLRVSPQQVAAGMLARWPACTDPHLWLFGNGLQLEWTGACTLPEGIMSFRVANDTGLLEALGGPAQPPPTAIPIPAASSTPASTATDVPSVAAQTSRGTFSLTGQQALEIAVFMDFIRAYNNGRIDEALALLSEKVSGTDCDYQAVTIIQFNGKAQAVEWLRTRLSDHDRLEIGGIYNENPGAGGAHVIGVEFSRRTSSTLEGLGFGAGITPKLSAKVVFEAAPALIRSFANGPYGGDPSSCRPGD